MKNRIIRTGLIKLFGTLFELPTDHIKAIMIPTFFITGIGGLLFENYQCYPCIALNIAGILIAILEFLAFCDVRIKLWNHIASFSIVAFGVAVWVTEFLNINTASDRFFMGIFLLAGSFLLVTNKGSYVDGRNNKTTRE